MESWIRRAAPDPLLHGPAADAGIQPGDIIQQINHQPVRSADDVRVALQKSGDRPALVLLNRDGANIFVPLRLS
jgi:serine protease Do